VCVFPTGIVLLFLSSWRDVLRSVQRSGCGGAECLLDNRQQSHLWGPWMWVEGGSYAEPLMSDEQPSSWAAYEPDLHTVLKAANLYTSRGLYRRGRVT